MFDPTTPPSDVSRSLPFFRRADISEWADDVSELAYMNPYPSASGTCFDHYPAYSYPSCPSTPTTFDLGNTTNSYLPQRSTSLSRTSLPLAKSPLPPSLIWAEETSLATFLPTPKRRAPLPPLHSHSRSRSRSRTQAGRKWRMTLVDPEQVGLWTLREDTEGQFDDALSPPPVPVPEQTREGHLLWGDSERERGKGYDDTVRQMVKGTNKAAWVAPRVVEGADPIGLGLAIRGGVYRSTTPLTTPRQKYPKPERQFDGLFYVPPALTGEPPALLIASNAAPTQGRETEASVMLASPMSSEESWGNSSPIETTPTMPSSDIVASPLAFPLFAEPRTAPPRPLRITTTPIPPPGEGAYAFPMFPELELGSPFTPMPMMTPCRPHTGAIRYMVEQEQIGSPLEELVRGARKRVTSAPAVVHWPDWSSSSSTSSLVSHSHTSSASSFLSSEGPITPPITAFQMQRAEKCESVVGEDLLQAFERFLMEAHEPTPAFPVAKEQEEKEFLGGDVTVHASPRTPPPKHNIEQVNQPRPPPATPVKKRHPARALQNGTPVPRSCEALQFVITTNTAEEAKRVPQTAPCFGSNGRDLVFDFRVVETGRERGVETCRASLVVPTGAEIMSGVDSREVKGSAGVASKGKGKRLPQRVALPHRWMGNDEGL
ncbi:hypothetical protein QFC22_005706 [Naganishia vaughanmartiniae]|uniref:Uncharacterized protein n=1 Tax=Naganishia vaughanmartiniae TaxID=1424756 RepID=A0ACC2WSW0_9TREE|nr:hypothetical protein QFC22_005706 [Naganishia vaughanmartiniae]